MRLPEAGSDPFDSLYHKSMYLSIQAPFDEFKLQMRHKKWAKTHFPLWNVSLPAALTPQLRQGRKYESQYYKEKSDLTTAAAAWDLGQFPASKGLRYFSSRKGVVFSQLHVANQDLECSRLLQSAPKCSLSALANVRGVFVLVVIIISSKNYSLLPLYSVHCR